MHSGTPDLGIINPKQVSSPNLSHLGSGNPEEPKVNRMSESKRMEDTRESRSSKSTGLMHIKIHRD